MELHLFRQLWGLDPPWTGSLGAFRDFGYRGVEVALAFVEPESAEEIRASGLAIVPMIFTTGRDVPTHVESFRTQAQQAAQLNPPFITCHDGRDAFDRDDATRYYREVLAVEADLGVPVAHETHRGRILFNPWVTASVLDEFADIRLCCDFSHWVVVCERLIDDQIEIIRQCADRAIHVHARVGYNEGPQVPDPSDPLFAEELAAHERWWITVWASQRRRGVAVTTLTPEFGPPPYMQTEPFTGKPVADQQLVSDWQAARQRQRFAAFLNQAS